MKTAKVFCRISSAWALIAAAVAFPARAQLLADPVVIPAHPAPFERVDVRLTVDDCVFNPDSVRVTSEQGLTQIAMTPRLCLLAGPTKVVEIQVGAFAAGHYRVDVVVNQGSGPGPSRIWPITFTVVAPPEIAIFPPPPRPLANYGGVWWNPAGSGWWLSIHQDATRTLVAGWYVYDAAGQPVWYTIQPGHWIDFRTWTGVVYQTSGPRFFEGAFDPALVLVQPVGTATLNFDQTPATVNTATITYTVHGVTATKTISRLRF
jgi:hypothetical protein